MEWMIMPLKRYAEFSGRSRRKEYWMYFLFLVIVNLLVGMVESVVGLAGTVGPYGPLSILVVVVTFVPSLAVGIRRLHDTERSGWWILLPLVPYAISAALLVSGNLSLGGMIGIVGLLCALGLLVLMVLEGTKGPNRYGPDPKGGDQAAAFT
jgi:uncharacterized membrane protein YhaH (DUF805 family)